MICLDDQLFVTPAGQEMADVFAARSSVARIMAFEAALARVQARRGVIPMRAADDISAKATFRCFPQAEWALQRAKVGHPLVSILQAWMTRLEPESREWLHYGATTADLFNTVLIQQLQEAGQRIVSQMLLIHRRLAVLAREHRETPMVARTLGRHALPFSFGMKVATWIAEHGRSIERLEHWLVRYKTGILSGAVGTYASFGEDGPAIEREVMIELGLGEPESVDWKGSRDRFAEFGCAVALAARTCGHVAHEIFLMSGDDIDEVSEVSGEVGSSTMPHKANPNRCIDVVSRSREVSARLSPLLEWIGVIFERDSAQQGDTLRDMCVGMADLLANMDTLLKSLVVQPEHMRSNLARTQGMIMSEALTFALAQRVGKQTAHHEVERLARWARENGCSLTEAVARDPAMIALQGDLADSIDPVRYLGLSAKIADDAAGSVKA